MESLRNMLESNRYLHLGTCKDSTPSVSLMNYTFVDGIVVLASPPKTAKIVNIEANPNVSLLVHELMSEGDKTLSDYLRKLNTCTLFGQKSATIAGYARITTGEEAEIYRAKHLAAHPSASCFIANCAIIVVELKSAKIADDTNNVVSIDL